MSAFWNQEWNRAKDELIAMLYQIETELGEEHAKACVQDLLTSLPAQYISVRQWLHDGTRVLPSAAKTKATEVARATGRAALATSQHAWTASEPLRRMAQDKVERRDGRLWM